MHESFHSFNCVNGGPVGSLDEGSAIWVIPVELGQELIPGQSLAKTTYGSKLFHNVFFPSNHGAAHPDRQADRGLRVVRGARPVAASLELHRAPRDLLRGYFADLDRNIYFFGVFFRRKRAFISPIMPFATGFS